MTHRAYAAGCTEKIRACGECRRLWFGGLLEGVSWTSFGLLDNSWTTLGLLDASWPLGRLFASWTPHNRFCNLFSVRENAVFGVLVVVLK